MNPNYDEMANPDDTYVDLSFAKDRSGWRLPAQKPSKKRGSSKTGPVSDTMQNILLHLNTIPGIGPALPPVEDTPFVADTAMTVDDGFEERPSGPFPMILPNLPNREFRTGGIPESELAAARRGQRWHWHNENSFMPPGSEWNKTVWQGADRENQWLTQMLKRAAADKGGIMSPIAQVRLRAQWLSERNKTIQDYINGNWDDPERAYKDFQSAIDKIDTKLRELGEDEALLRPVPPVAGKRSGFTTQSRPMKLREQYNFAKTVNDELSTWLEPGDNGKRKIDDPEFVNSKKFYLDSVYERLLKHIKDSSNSMADEEKQRLQILVLPDNAMDEVIKEVQGFQAALRGIMASASAKDWSQNNRGKVNEVIEATGFEPSRDKATLGHQLAALGGTLVDSFSSNDELPHDVATDLQAAKTKFDRYMKNMMLSASVAPHLVANLSALLANTIVPEYNDQAQKSSRGKADLLEPIVDISKQIPKNAMPLSELIKHSDYIWPSLAEMPKGKVSTNPESKGENKPAGTDTVPGVSFED